MRLQPPCGALTADLVFCATWKELHSRAGREVAADMLPDMGAPPSEDGELQTDSDPRLAGRRERTVGFALRWALLRVRYMGGVPLVANGLPLHPVDSMGYLKHMQ